MSENGDSKLGAAADPAKVKKQESKANYLRRRELDDLFTVLSSAQGRRVIWRYLEFCGVFKTSFTGNSETFYREGQRNVGLKLLAEVNECDSSAYTKMLEESKKLEEILNA